MSLKTEWQENGWEADYWAPYLVLTNPQGEVASVILQDATTRRSITLQQFRSSVANHGVTRACEVFWKLRANQ